MNILSGIWSKVAAVMAAIAGVFFMIMRYQSNKINKLEDENKKIKKKSEIQTAAAIDKARIMAAEQDEILAMTKEVSEDDKKITRDDLNSL